MSTCRRCESEGLVPGLVRQGTLVPSKPAAKQIPRPQLHPRSKPRFGKDKAGQPSYHKTC